MLAVVIESEIIPTTSLRSQTLLARPLQHGTLATQAIPVPTSDADRVFRARSVLTCTRAVDKCQLTEIVPQPSLSQVEI